MLSVTWMPAFAGMTNFSSPEVNHSETLGLHPRVVLFSFSNRRSPLIDFGFGHITARDNARVFIAPVLEIRKILLSGKQGSLADALGRGLRIYLTTEFL